jgi:hypothetical protein
VRWLPSPHRLDTDPLSRHARRNLDIPLPQLLVVLLPLMNWVLNGFTDLEITDAPRLEAKAYGELKQ